VTSGSPTIGAGVNVAVNGFGALELAGSNSALVAGANRANIANSSSAAVGIIVSGTNQAVGNIDGSGTTQVNAGSDLTASHIVQSALAIGGASSSHGFVTIDASDSSGNPLGELGGIASGDSLGPSGPFGAGGIGLVGMNSVGSSELASLSPSRSDGSGSPSSVPEPCTLLLVLLAITSLIGQTIAIRRRARRTDL
jgi:hypothetical protein